MEKTAGDRNQVIGPAAQFLANVIDQKVEIAVLPHDTREDAALDRLAGGKGRRLDAVHPFAPARFRRPLA